MPPRATVLGAVSLSITFTQGVDGNDEKYVAASNISALVMPLAKSIISCVFALRGSDDLRKPVLKS